MGAALSNTIARVVHTETKQFRERLRGNADVDKELRTMMAVDEEHCRQGRIAFQEHMQQAQKRKRLDKDMKEMAAKLAKTRKASRAYEAVVTEQQALKTFSLEALGKGRKNGGGDPCRKARGAVLERIRLIAELSIEQRNDWEYFKTHWDREMAKAQGEKWAEAFAEMMQNVLTLLQNGETNAFSVFMHRETQRVLSQDSALVLPGA